MENQIWKVCYIYNLLLLAIFDSTSKSKDLFNKLNTLKLKPKDLISKLRQFQIPEKSKATEEDRLISIEYLNTLPQNYKAKSYLWNERVASALRTTCQKKINGEHSDETLEEVASKVTASSQLSITGQYSVNGKYDDEETIILLLILENSKDVKSILVESGQIGAVCSVLSKSRMKMLNCFVFAKKI